MPKAWKRIDPTVVAKIGYRTIVTKTFTMPDGATQDFQVYDVEGREYVAIAALTEDNQVLVLRQFRPGPQQIFDEVPGGFVDDGEDKLAAAHRELEEETGYKAGRMQYLGKSFKDAYNNAIWHYYLATDCTPTNKGQILGDLEYADLSLISIAEFMDNAVKGKMTDAEAVLMAYEYLRALK